MIERINQWYRLDKPHECPHAIYELMLSCWKEYYKARPRFGYIKNKLIEISKSIIELQTSQLINESMVQSHTIFTWAFSESNIVRLKKEKDDLNGDHKAEQLFAFGHDDACYQKHFVVSYYLSSNVYSGAFGKEFVLSIATYLVFFRTLTFKKFLLLFVFF